MFMRQLLAVALVLTVVAVPACAQRGGARGGGSAGFRGGFSGHAIVASHGGFSEGGQYRYAGGPHVQSYRPVGRAVVSGPDVPSARSFNHGISSARPVFYNRGRAGRREGRRGVPYVYPRWLDSGYLWYPDDDGFYDYDDDSANGSVDDSGTQAENYDEEPQAEYQPATEEPAQPSTAALAQTVTPTLYDSDALTLVFKDGRPSEKIHNYALTRTTLYVTDAHHREIPVADLDLAAMKKVNREAGVSFQLPHAGQ